MGSFVGTFFFGFGSGRLSGRFFRDVFRDVFHCVFRGVFRDVSGCFRDIWDVLWGRRLERCLDALGELFLGTSSGVLLSDGFRD